MVTTCALNPAWPIVSSSLKEVVFRDSDTGDSANLDTIVLRVALLVHRQLFTTDGSDEALGMGIAAPPPSLPPPMARPSNGSGGDVAQSKRVAAATIPINRETERFRGTSFSDA